MFKRHMSQPGAPLVCANFLQAMELPWPEAEEVFLHLVAVAEAMADRRQEDRISWEVNYIQECWWSKDQAGPQNV